MYSDVCEIIPGLFLGNVNDVDDMVRMDVDVLVPLAFMRGNIWDTKWRGEIIYCPITDMDILPDDVLYYLVEMISNRLSCQKKVGIFCAGGHGRTGYVAACVLADRGVTDPIGYLRTHYSPKAIETDKQAQAVFRFIHIEEETERLIREEAGPLDWLGSCGVYNQTKKRILKEHFGIEWKSPLDKYKGLLID